MADGIWRIELPYPPSVNQWTRALGYGRAVLTRQAREYKKVVSALMEPLDDILFPEERLEVLYLVTPPDRRKRDCQNMPHMLKAYIDGIADAMGCDDNGFRVRYPDRFDHTVKGGAILCEVECGADGTAEIPVKGTIS